MFESNQKNKSAFSFIEKNEAKATKLGISIALTILIVSILRGFFPILLEGLIDAKLIYFFLSGLMLVYASFLVIACNFSILPPRLIFILLLNLLFYISWLMVDLLAGVNVFFFFSLAIFPFLIVIYSKVPSVYFNRIIFLLIPIISGAVIFDYLLANTYIFNNGFDLREELRGVILTEYHAPTHTFNSFSVTGTTYRAVGLTGEEHETASILVMLSAFLLAANNQILQLKFRILLLAMTYLALLLTSSAANIVMGIFASMIIIAYKLRKVTLAFTIKSIAVVLIIITISLVYFSNFVDLLSVPFIRVANSEAIVKMLGQQLDPTFIDELISLIVGHTRQLELSVWGHITEIAYFRILYTAGLPTFIVTNLIWCIPFFYLCKADKYTREKMFAYVAAVCAGLFTLSHYGTLLRMTNIILFYSFFGMSIRMYVLSTEFINKAKVDSSE